MPSIEVRGNEPFDIALRRFRRACEKASIIPEIRKREYYEKPTTIRKRNMLLAKRRQKRRTQLNNRAMNIKRVRKR